MFEDIQEIINNDGLNQEQKVEGVLRCCEYYRFPFSKLNDKKERENMNPTILAYLLNARELKELKNSKTEIPVDKEIE